MFSCSRFRGRHIADNISQQVDKTLASYDIGKKIATVVTDNASKMVKTFSLPGFDDSADNQDETTDDDEPSPEQIDDDLLMQHDTCFVHTLQPVIKDVLKLSACSQRHKVKFTTDNDSFAA